MLKVDSKIIIAIILMTIVTHDVAPQWCDWLTDSIVGTWLQKTYDFLSEYVLIRVIVALSLLSGGALWAWRIFRDKDFRWYRLALLIWGFVILFDHNTLESVKLWNDLSYKGLAIIVGILAIMAISVNIIDRFFPFQDKIKTLWKERNEKRIQKKSSRNKDNINNGFPNDNIKPQHTPKALQQYAEVISEQVLGTNIGEHSFAIGITGEWGSGKTTFLDLLESKLEVSAEIVKFNPWMCRTPEQVTNDFFATLQQQLSFRHSSLSKPIQEYARYISNISFSWGNEFLSKIAFGFAQDSLQEKKKRLSERFAMLSKPIVVIIDDLDRLESDEVFEVLRLIRNTADLKNTIYVVAYDKEYVTLVLRQKHIKDSSAYLEKIFPVEIHQPKVEDYQIIHVLYNDLKRVKLFNGDFANELLKRVNSKEKALIVKILGNYRQTRRFVSVYSLNVMYIQKVFTNEIKLMDLFWMELLQTYDKIIYDKLAKDPNALLYQKAGRYNLRPNIVEKDYVSEIEYAYKGEKIWKDDTPQLLELLFGKSIAETDLSICRTENYEKFFTLSVSPYKLSKHEFKNLFLKKGEEENTIKSWIDDGKHLSSIRYEFVIYNVYRLDNNKLNSYIKGVLSFVFLQGAYNYDDCGTIRSLFAVSRFKQQQCKDATRFIYEWFEDKIRQHQNPVVVTKMLNRLYQSTEYDEYKHIQENEQLLTSNNDVKLLLKKAMEEYLNQHTGLTASEIFNEKSEVGKLFGNCCVKKTTGIIDDIFDAWENVAIDIVIKHFQGQHKIPINNRNDVTSNMFLDYLPKQNDNPDFYEYASEQWNRMLNAYFGTDRDLTRLIDTCYTVVSNKDDLVNESNEKPNDGKETKGTLRKRKVSLKRGTKPKKK